MRLSSRTCQVDHLHCGHVKFFCTCSFNSDVALCPRHSLFELFQPIILVVFAILSSVAAIVLFFSESYFIITFSFFNEANIRATTLNFAATLCVFCFCVWHVSVVMSVLIVLFCFFFNGRMLIPDLQMKFATNKETSSIMTGWYVRSQG